MPLLFHSFIGGLKEISRESHPCTTSELLIESRIASDFKSLVSMILPLVPKKNQ